MQIIYLNLAMKKKPAAADSHSGPVVRISDQTETNIKVRDVPLMILDIVPITAYEQEEMHGQQGDQGNEIRLPFRFQILFSKLARDVVYSEKRWISDLGIVDELPQVVRMLQEYRHKLDNTLLGRPRDSPTLEKRKILRDYCAARSMYSIVFKLDTPVDQLENVQVLEQFHKPSRWQSIGGSSATGRNGKKQNREGKRNKASTVSSWKEGASIWVQKEEREFEGEYYHNHMIAETKELRYLKKLREKQTREARFNLRQQRIAEFYSSNSRKQQEPETGKLIDPSPGEHGQVDLRALKQTPARTEAPVRKEQNYDGKHSQRKFVEASRSSSPSRYWTERSIGSRDITNERKELEEELDDINCLLGRVIQANALQVAELKESQVNIDRASLKIPSGFATPHKCVVLKHIGEDDITPRKPTREAACDRFESLLEESDDKMSAAGVTELSETNQAVPSASISSMSVVTTFQNHLVEWLRSEFFEKIEKGRKRKAMEYISQDVYKISKQLSTQLTRMSLEEIMPGIRSKLGLSNTTDLPPEPN